MDTQTDIDLNLMVCDLRAQVRSLFERNLGAQFSAHSGVPRTTLQRFSLDDSSPRCDTAQAIRDGLSTFDAP